MAKKKVAGPARIERMGQGWCVFLGVMPCGGWAQKKDAQVQADLMNRAMTIWVNEPEGQIWLSKVEGPL